MLQSRIITFIAAPRATILKPRAPVMLVYRMIWMSRLKTLNRWRVKKNQNRIQEALWLHLCPGSHGQRGQMKNQAWHQGCGKICVGARKLLWTGSREMTVFVWAESLALQMQSMPVPQRSLFRLWVEQFLYDVQHPATQLTTSSNVLAASYSSQCEMTDTQYTPMTNAPFFQN